MFGYFGHLFYIGLLLTNAVAVLSEERFLAKIGWSANSSQQANQGFGHANNPNIYSQSYGGNEGGSIKSKIVNLIGATRTLMRMPLIVANIVVIIYEVLLGYPIQVHWARSRRAGKIETPSHIRNEY